MSTDTQSPDEEHSKEECLETEAWLITEDADEPDQTNHGQSIDERVTCPICGRTWEYVYILEGLWNPRTNEYVRDF